MSILPPQLWSTGVAAIAPDDLDPVGEFPFTLAPTDPVATAGTCFAQHLPHHLRASGYNFLQAELPATLNEPVYSARYGNIPTTRQLRQLMLNAYGLLRPAIRAWRRADGRYVDPLRPQIFPAGFAMPNEVAEARVPHLAAVRRVFQECRVFVFTLGTNETWAAPDGTCVPLPPAVVDAETPENKVSAISLSAAEMRQDLTEFLADLTAVNPNVRVILTVSPVPPAATFQSRHILTASKYAKAALRVAAEETAAAHAHVAYFPSYDIITAPRSRAHYFADDFRTLTNEAIARTLHLFATHVMAAPAPIDALREPAAEPGAADDATVAALIRREDASHLARPLAPPPAAPQTEQTAAASDSPADQFDLDMADTGNLPLEIDFRTGGQGHQFLVAGWSHPELEFAWTLGKQASIRLPTGGANCDCALKFRAGPMVHPGLITYQRLYVEVNGMNVAKLVGRQLSQFDILVPAAALHGSSTADIILHLPDATSPDEIGLSGDKRELGFWLSSLRLEPLVASPISAPQPPPHAATAAPSTDEPEDIADTKTIMMDLQSLGVNCELGLVQRAHAAEPLGLLRWANTPLPNLLRAIEARFEGLGHPENTVIQIDADTEFQIIDKKFGFRNHSFAFQKDGATAEKIRERELVRIPFLARLLVEDLEQAEKLFCFHDAGHSSMDDIHRLLAAMAKYGPGWLLWICPAKTTPQVGTAELIHDRLIRGYIDKFQPLTDVSHPSVEAWTEAVHAGHRIWRRALRS